MATPFDTDDDDFSFLDWGVGVYPAVRPTPEEPDGQRLTRIAQAKRDGERLWEAVQKELVKRG